MLVNVVKANSVDNFKKLLNNTGLSENLHCEVPLKFPITVKNQGYSVSWHGSLSTRRQHLL